MKKLLLFVFTILPLLVNAEPVEIDGIYYNLLSKGDNKIAEVSYSPQKYSGNIVIPESVFYDGTEYKVVSIGSYAFTECQDLVSITLPNSIKVIEKDAFGNGSFYNTDSQLRAVKISSLETWFNIEFKDDCSPLYYGAGHLYLNGEEIKELIIPDGITFIPRIAFKGCVGLTKVVIPNSVTHIGDYSFDSCGSLKDVSISNSVTTIGSGVFNGCI